MEHPVSKECDDPDQTPHSVASVLTMHYLPLSHKKMLSCREICKEIKSSVLILLVENINRVCVVS